MESPILRLRQMNVLFRPYPERHKNTARLLEHGIQIFPFESKDVKTVNYDKGLYDSIFYATAVIAIEGTACLDSLVIGRPCLVFLHPQFRDVQSTEYFQSLVNSKAVYVAKEINDINVFLSDKSWSNSSALARQRFISEYLRPCGKSASEIIVENIVKMLPPLV